MRWVWRELIQPLISILGHVGTTIWMLTEILDDD